jgi:hypothetical protein
MHFVLAAPISFASFLAELAFWRRFRKENRWPGYGVLSLVMLVITLVSGSLTVIFVASSYRGLL